MQAATLKQVRRQRRKMGIRKRIVGTPERPRLSVYRSLRHLYAQIIDDVSGKTLASASSMHENLEKGGGNKAAAVQVGKALAQCAKAAGITKVALDRGGFKYHGRIKAMAEAAREGGLQF